MQGDAVRFRRVCALSFHLYGCFLLSAVSFFDDKASAGHRFCAGDSFPD